MLVQVFNVRTLWVKFVSCAAAVGSGLPVGPEGPMIHIGAMIGAALSQGHSTTLGFATGLFKRFQNPKDKRDFVTAGMFPLHKAPVDADCADVEPGDGSQGGCAATIPMLCISWEARQKLLNISEQRSEHLLLVMWPREMPSTPPLSHQGKAHIYLTKQSQDQLTVCS